MNYEQRTRMLKLGSRKDIEGDAPFGRDFMSRLNLIGQTEALSDAYPGADISGSDRFNADHPYLTSAYRVMLPTLLAEVAGGAAGAAAGPVGLPLGIGIGALTGGLGGTLWDTIQKRELKRKLLAAGSKVDKGSLSRGLDEVRNRSALTSFLYPAAASDPAYESAASALGVRA